MVQLQSSTRETLKQIIRFTFSVGQAVWLSLCLSPCPAWVSDEHLRSVSVIVPKPTTCSQRQNCQTRVGRSVLRSEIHIQVRELCVPLGMPSPLTRSADIVIGHCTLAKDIMLNIFQRYLCECEVWRLTLRPIIQILWLSSDMTNPLWIHSSKNFEIIFYKKRKKERQKLLERGNYNPSLLSA